MTQTQFVVAITRELAAQTGWKAERAMKEAARLYKEYLDDIKVPFGSPAYDWSDEAAREIIGEYFARCH